MPKKTAKTAKPKARKSADNTAKKVPGRPFKPGAEWAGNAEGRPKGSRNKLCGQFIADLQEVWSMAADADISKIANMTRGQQALLAVSVAKPDAFIKAVGNLVPSEFDLGDKTRAGFSSFLQALKGGEFKPRAFDPNEDNDV